jgi:hypothetical protein
MTPAQQQAIDSLRDDGYLVIIWTPEELGNIGDTSYLEDRIIELGNDMIGWEETATDDTRSNGPHGASA